jgi:RimJ/RimL family protein N-acetyltransferase
VILKALTLNELQFARQWRNQLMSAWRTPYMLTEKMQEDFYYNIVSDRRGNHRYWGFHIREDNFLTFVGYGGITGISWEAHTGEISILIGPDYRGGGAGSEALRLMLNEGFNTLNLDVIHAECYFCNKSIEWWDKMSEKYNTETYELPYRKYWNGKLSSARFYYFKRDKCKPLL